MSDAEDLAPLGGDAIAMTEPSAGTVGVVRVAADGATRTIARLGARASAPH